MYLEQKLSKICNEIHEKVTLFRRGDLKSAPPFLKGPCFVQTIIPLHFLAFPLSALSLTKIVSICKGFLLYEWMWRAPQQVLPEDFLLFYFVLLPVFFFWLVLPTPCSSYSEGLIFLPLPCCRKGKNPIDRRWQRQDRATPTLSPQPLIRHWKANLKSSRCCSAVANSLHQHK